MRSRPSVPIAPPLALLVATCGFLLGCARAASPPTSSRAELLPLEPGAARGHNVVLVSFDTTRWDRIGCYGSAADATPNVDALAARGVLCEQAATPAPITLPAHASLLTGLRPPAHGSRTNGMAVSADAGTLAERLSGAGYATGAFVSAYVLTRRFGLARGFERYDDGLTHTDDARYSQNERRGDATVDAALEWLEERDERPYFLFVHLFDPHGPYLPPPPFDERFADRPYEGEIAFADHQLGRLLEALRARGEEERTLVAFTADHGESFGEHGEPLHAYLLYDATVRVPLVFSAPGLLEGPVRLTSSVSLVDVAPTVLDLLGLDSGSSVDGRSLLHPSAAERTGVLVESLNGTVLHGWEPLFAVRGGAAKAIGGLAPEYYDLAADPGELRNLWPERKREWEALFGPWAAEIDAARGRAPSAAADAETRARLEALGYLAGDGSTESDTRVDPARGIALVAAWHEALDLRAAGRLREAALHMDRAVGAGPDHDFQRGGHADLWADVGRELLTRSKPLRAAEAYERAVAIDGDCVAAHVGLAILRSRPGPAHDPEAALAHAERARELRPREATTWALVATCLAGLGQPERAAEHQRRAVELAAPGDRARLEADLQRYERAARGRGE